jgi:hypothetical protein
MTDTTASTYICCRCIGNEEPYMNMIYCRVCNVSAVCKSCFAYMERKYEVKEIVCPICSNVYYGELRNSIVKYALEYSIGIEHLPLRLMYLWKRNYHIHS